MLLLSDFYYRGYENTLIIPKEIYETASGNTITNLDIVKTHIDLVAKLAILYASETGKPFSKILQTGIISLTKAVKNFHDPQHPQFVDYMKRVVIEAMVNTDTCRH